jgi:glycosyltransferase involved in cell wall biosynthesis|tara:strand:+ start:7875 stop:9026 length:1152 start_codon:yes stop_codon:yes gene_type:complete
MNVQFVIGQYSPTIGGAEIQAERLAHHLSRKGISVNVVSSKSSQSKSFVKKDNVPLHVIGSLPLPLLKRVIFLIKLYCYLNRHKVNYEIIHAHQGFEPTYVAVKVAKKLGKPVIVKIGNSGERFDLKLLSKKFPKTIHSYMSSYIIRNTTMFVSINSTIRHSLIMLGVPESKIIKIPNGVSTHEFKPSMNKEQLRNQLGISPFSYVIINVANLEPKKNHSVLIKAMRYMETSKENCLLLLLGDGSNRDNLHKSIIKYGLTESVIMKGKVKNVKDYLAASDIFVLPSHSEGLSNALLEAMSTGLPCIVSDINGNRQVITHNKTGLLFDPDKPRSLYRSIVKVKNDNELYQKFSKESLNTIQASYEINLIADKYCYLYNKVLYTG